MDICALGEEDGLPIVPVFTSEEALASWRPAAPFIGLDGRVVLRLLVETPWSKIVLDPGGPRSIEVTRMQAAKLLS